MSRRLLLVRHAKSSWKNAALPDLDRPLTRRGRRQARKAGRRLALRDLQPELVLCSPARRALKTARIICKALGYRRRDIVVDPQLYGTSAARLLARIRALEEGYHCVMLCGHNPELSELARRFAPALEPLRPGRIAAFELPEESWGTVGRSEGGATRPLQL